MLNIFICPKCMNFRIVSRNPEPTCFHCGDILNKTNLDYVKYSNMSEDERNTYQENYKKKLRKEAR